MHPDGRFYETLAPATIAELASVAGAALTDAALGDRLIRRVSILAHAGAEDIGFCADAKRADELAKTAAGAAFVLPAQADAAPEGCARLRTASPQAAWARAASRLHRPRRDEPGSPAIHPGARLEEGVSLAPGVVVCAGAAVGRGSVLAAGAVIGPGVQVGRDCYIGANVVVGFALIGDRVTILAGAVIGEAGFGVAAGDRGLIDVPQLGRVILQDGVTIGAGSCVDRGAWDDTVIGENSKIDNLVQIAHNVSIGRNCVLAAHTGISGSVTIGDNCQLGGRVGVADHVSIGAGARIAAASGLMRDVPPGEAWGGIPARPVRRWMRETAWLGQMANRRSGGRDEG